MTTVLRALGGLFFAATTVACGAQDTDESAAYSEEQCGLNPEDPANYVLVGFWSTSDCSGDPIRTNPFPVDADADCYCWSGNSGQNSADTFICDAAARTFTYTQYNSLTCGADDDTPTQKTVSDTCTQDIPPTLYSKLVDFGACEATTR